MTPATDSKSKAADLSRYEALLAEAADIRGVSLGQDAWRRLKKNRAAVVSLFIVGGVVLVALLTPFLPLQSPQYQDLKNRQLKPPEFTRNELPLKIEDIRTLEKDVAELRSRIAQVSGDERQTLTRELESRQREHPFRRLWNNLGPLNSALTHARLSVFGTWCIPSVCGTDSLGRDVLSRICWGMRVSILVGIVATLVSLTVGVVYGAISGYAGGWTDQAMMRLVEILSSIPFIFVVIFLLTIFSEDKVKTTLLSLGIGPITVFCFAIGIFFWLTMARVVRGQVLSLKNEQFVDAARTIGADGSRIVLKHLVPNVLGIVIIYLTLTIPSVMLTEAFLSFLGLGVQAPDVSLGVLVDEGIRVITPIKIYWWAVIFPAGILAVTLLALTFIGDGLRDALDPRLKNRG